MPRFELKISWSRGHSVLAVLTLLVAAFVCCQHDAQHATELVQAPVTAEAPPPFQSGLPEDYREKAREAFEAFPQPFRIAGTRSDLRQKSVYLWNAVLQVESPGKPRGQHYTCGPQQTGDCVSWGGGAAIYTTGANAVIAGTASAIDDPCQPVLYGIARVTQGGRRPRCGQAGAYPSDLAAGFKKYGWATWSEVRLQYSGGLADRMGCDGPSSDHLRLANARAGGDCYPIRTVDELLEALHNGYAGTAGIDWRPGSTRDDRGRIVTQFNGRYLGGHQVAWVGWDGERQHLIFANSHGPNAHPRNSDDPPGSFRVTLSTLETMLSNGEFWAFSSVPGFPPQEIDLSPLRPRKRPAQTKDVSHAHPLRSYDVRLDRPHGVSWLLCPAGRGLPAAVHHALQLGNSGRTRFVGHAVLALGCDGRGSGRRLGGHVCPAALDCRASRRPGSHATPAAGSCA